MGMTLRGIALAAATLALAACSQGASDAPSGPASSGSYVDAPAVTEPAESGEDTDDVLVVERTETPTPPATLGELAALAATIGCTGYEDDSESSPFTREYGTCVGQSGKRVQLYRFGTPEAMAGFWEVSKQFGQTPDLAATKDLIVAFPNGPADLAGIKAAMGVQ